jgi:hypothetical protein
MDDLAYESVRAESGRDTSPIDRALDLLGKRAALVAEATDILVSKIAPIMRSVDPHDATTLAAASDSAESEVVRRIRMVGERLDHIEEILRAAAGRVDC